MIASWYIDVLFGPKRYGIQERMLQVNDFIVKVPE